ncbi:hypothetical protein [Verrucosispora sp. WMMD1129]|uniref:hypothetical protein n=1 Tax=Verrucosispora sp. WMMD1129 TaxID=3016093 RepID=UPI00249BC5E5|nr:hypothetical protein [Verrucosispora sp. WMMD1129]WFE44998.1 hypothetical protein O7624_11945 [Verrucosispora sp. WMMD1129]WFE46292.1 hypothetical protein O7624_19040 [Verrucosispora sp. WMMD1129]
MAISSCSTCGTSEFRSLSIDSTGALAICAKGHHTFDPSSTDDGGIQTGRIKVKGQSAIGNGAVAIGSTGERKKDKKRWNR